MYNNIRTHTRTFSRRDMLSPFLMMNMRGDRAVTATVVVRGHTDRRRITMPTAAALLVTNTVTSTDTNSFRQCFSIDRITLCHNASCCVSRTYNIIGAIDYVEGYGPWGSTLSPDKLFMFY